MSEAQSVRDRIAARLERLAELDLAAAEHVHAQLMASTEPATTTDLSRAYQRASRTLRQTLMLQMRHEKGCAEAEAKADREAEPEPTLGEAALDRLIDARTTGLQDAVGRIAAAEYPDSPRRQREYLDRLDVEIDEWDETEFLADDLDDKVVEACERIRLPTTRARQWEDLPPAPITFDPAETPPPTADTG